MDEARAASGAASALVGLSAIALEELRGLLEAATPSVPASMVSEIAVFELAEAGLVSGDLEGELELALGGAGSAAALEATGAVPCRLGLLLGGWRSEELAALARRVGAPGLGVEAIEAVLSDAERLARVVGGRSARAVEALGALVDAGGYACAEEGVASSLGGEALEELASHGLVFRTGGDVRVAAEVLRALLEGRLRRRLDAVVEAWRHAARSGRQDNLVMFPVQAGRLLGELGELLRERSAWSLEELRVALGLAGTRLPVEALVELAALVGVARRRGETCSAGVVLRVERRYEQWQRLTPEERLERVIALVVEGGPSSPAEGPLAELTGLPQGLEEGGLDEQEASGWAALPPHLAASMELTGAPAGQAQGRALARALLHCALAALEPGHLYPLEALERLAGAVGAAARTFARRVGTLYAPEAEAPGAEAVSLALRAWIGAVAAPLGWASVEVEAGVAAGGAELEGEGRGWDEATLPLFDLPARASRPGRSVASPGAAAEVAQVRVSQRWPRPDAEALLEVLTGAGACAPVLAELLGRPWGEVGASVAGAWGRGGSGEVAWYDTLAMFCAECAEPGQVGPLRSLEGYLRRAGVVGGWEGIGEVEICGFLRSVLRGRRGERDRMMLRRLFSGLEGLSAWLERRGEVLGFAPPALRARVEGPVLRADSVEAAVRAFQGKAPPEELLRYRPELTWRGAARVVGIDQEFARVKVWPLEDGGDARVRELVVRMDGRAVAFLRVGDVFDGNLVRYGHACWITHLRWVLPGVLAQVEGGGM